MTDPRLLAFGLYASEGMWLNDGVRISPWRMGTGGHLWMGTGTRAQAYTHVKGNVTLGRASDILGDLRYGGTYTPQVWSMTYTGLIPDQSITPLRMQGDPTPISQNSSIVVEAGQSRTLLASQTYPTTVMVRSKGTLVLVGGDFQFRSLVLNSGAKLVLQGDPDTLIPQRMSIRVSNEMIVDNAVMSGLRLDPRAVLWKWEGAQEIFLNGASRFLGSLLAPRARVSLASSAGFQGSLWAREIVIHQYNENLRFWPYTGQGWVRQAGEWVNITDSDQDGVDDTLEFRLGSDPLLPDTDGDGYSDGLEYFGRGGQYGAIKGISGSPARYGHSWGWALDTTRRDLFNPLRRDQFMRFVWQDSADIRRRGSEFHAVWDEGSGACADRQRYGVSPAMMFDGVWDESAYLDRLVEMFADPSDKPLVDAPYSARVPDYTVTLHIDAGPSATRNLDPVARRYGGAVIVSQAGVDTGRGPYAFDLDGDGRLSAYSFYYSKSCTGEDIEVNPEPERDTLLSRMFRGWTADPLRDIWVVNLGVAANQLPMGNGGYAIDFPLWSTEGAGNPIESQIGILHEYGHVLGLMHHGQQSGGGNSGSALLYDGVMNYSFNWGRVQRCSQTQGATWSDTRWCGEEPAEIVEGNNRGWRYWSDPSNAWFNIAWWRSGTIWNPRTTTADTVLYESGGPLDPRTGFRKVRSAFTVNDIGFSAGRYCDLQLDGLKEWEGISRCRDSHGQELPTPLPGTPIDWNQNGIIDMTPVDLFGSPLCSDWDCGGDREVPFFVKLNGEANPLNVAFDVARQQDHPDWSIISLEKGPYGSFDPINPPIKYRTDSRESLKGSFTW